MATQKVAMHNLHAYTKRYFKMKLAISVIQLSFLYSSVSQTKESHFTYIGPVLMPVPFMATQVAGLGGFLTNLM